MNDTIQTKRCSRCGEVKPISDFNKQKRASDGLQRYCKECQKAVKKEWYKANREEDTKQDIIDIEEGFKRCSRCGEVKPITEFYSCKSSKDGLYSYCKDCRSTYYQENKTSIREKAAKYRVQYYAKNKDAIAQKHAEYYAKNKDAISQKKADYYSPILNPIGYAKQKVQHYRWMDKERGFDPSQTISAEWFLENIMYKPCAHCGLLKVGAIGANRIDNTKGHTEDNVEAACWSCNASLGVKDAIERGLHWTCKRKANQSFKDYVNEHKKQSFKEFVNEHKAKDKNLT